jgi:hypothetical protein
MSGPGWPFTSQIDVRSHVSNQGQSGNVADKTNPTFLTQSGHCTVTPDSQAGANPAVQHELKNEAMTPTGRA